MPILKSIKKEKYARLVATQPVSNTDAYRMVSKKCNLHTARNESTRYMADHGIRSRIIEILDAQGCTDDALTSDLNHIRTESTKPITFEGIITQTVPDYDIRLKAINTLLKLRGHLNNELIDSKANYTQINYILGADEEKKIAADVIQEVIELRKCLGTYTQPIDTKQVNTNASA